MSLIENFVQNHVDLLKRNDYIDPSLYKELGVKSGLRNEDGKGVLAGLTNISQIISENIVDGKKQPCDGELWYRGHRINGLIEDLGDELGSSRKYGGRGARNYCQSPESAATARSQHRFLQRRPLLYARCTAVALYSVFCHRAYRRLVSTPAGRVNHFQQNHSSRL